ncbi:hypothetical protein [Amphibacillus sediminis]|uniref:hypothetical protein n=1 Tax=Amphibacillus sediminis TaxID=360185 RepID=UPI0008313F3B|nr:hypothetical protein [Amphibacillus sediminis]
MIITIPAKEQLAQTAQAEFSAEIDRVVPTESVPWSESNKYLTFEAFNCIDSTQKLEALPKRELCQQIEQTVNGPLPPLAEK